MIRFTSGSLFKVISLCKSGRRYSDEKIAEMLFPNVEYTTNYIGHVKDCTKNLPDEITQYMSDTDQEEIIDTLNRAVRKVFLTVISSEKQPILIAAIQKILEEDLSIADSTQVGYLPSYTKGNMKNATTVEPIEFIANALFSVCNQQNNQDGKEDIKNINPSFLEKLKSSAQRITLQIVQKPEEKIVINAIQPAVAGDDYSIIYLMDGDVNGRIKCTLANWTGLAFKIPRTALDLCKDRPELKQTGVYLLFGKDENDKSVVYIGQAGVRKNGEGILNRLVEHNRNPKKDYWTEAIALTTSNDYPV